MKPTTLTFFCVQEDVQKVLDNWVPTTKDVMVSFVKTFTSRIDNLGSVYYINEEQPKVRLYSNATDAVDYTLSLIQSECARVNKTLDLLNKYRKHLKSIIG